MIKMYIGLSVKYRLLLSDFNETFWWLLPIPVVARSKSEVYGYSPAEIVVSNPTGGMDVCLLGVLCIVR